MRDHRVFELTRVAHETIARTARVFEIYGAAAAMYFALGVPLMRVAARLNARLGRRDARQGARRQSATSLHLIGAWRDVAQARHRFAVCTCCSCVMTSNEATCSRRHSGTRGRS
jgi:hypothetical protein